MKAETPAMHGPPAPPVSRQVRCTHGQWCQSGVVRWGAALCRGLRVQFRWLWQSQSCHGHGQCHPVQRPARRGKGDGTLFPGSTSAGPCGVPSLRSQWRKVGAQRFDICRPWTVNVDHVWLYMMIIFSHDWLEQNHRI